MIALKLNLEVLVDVLERIHKALQFDVGPGAAVRWDAHSLLQIIGNCESTLNAAYALLEKNRRFARSGGVFRNFEWNMSVQQEAEALKQRIQRHNSRILLAIAPFEL